MKSISNNESSAKCGLFDFMAETMGISVLHPGGYNSTNKIISMLGLHNNSRVLDLACGVGTTSFLISKKYDCYVTGIDISNELIQIANKQKHDKKVKFVLADALHLPFADSTFDAIIAQAFLVLIDEKEQALKEIRRVLKPNGYFGSLELSWNKLPDKSGYNELLQKTCTTFIPRTLLYSKWEALFTEFNFEIVNVFKYPMTSGMFQMLKAEGIMNFIHIMKKMIENRSNRKRMMGVQKTFKKYEDFLGYGIYLLKGIS